MKPTKARIALAALYVCGGLAAVGFVITKSPRALAWAASGQYQYGDLYRFAQIRRFRPAQPLPLRAEGDGDSLDHGEALRSTDPVIFFGDSFGFADWGEFLFPTQLGRKLHARIFNVYRNHHANLWSNPSLLLATCPPSPGFRRLVIFEVAERLIQGQFSVSAPFPGADRLGVPPSAQLGPIKEFENDLLKETETRHEVLLKHSFLTAPIVSLWNSLDFDFFRQMPDETPWYSSDPPFLFFRDEIASYQAEHSAALVAKLADNLARLSQDLLTRYGCTLIFVPVPNKVSLYARLATDQPYDEFVPRLCQALQGRGVCAVNLLPRFRQEQDLVYWPTDTHWNNLGIRIAVDETLKQLAARP